MTSRYDVARDELSAMLADQPAFRATQVWEGLYHQLRSFEEMTNLPTTLRGRLASELPSALAEESCSTSDDGETTKVLWRLADGELVETVHMRYPDRVTVCVSTQAGCAMACGFCATGQAGFARHLGVGEIVEQVVAAARLGAPRRVSNVVFMGMGEPLANYDATWAAVRRLHDDLGISARHLTISTVGVVAGIRRLATEDLPVNLAVSLHAANDELRDDLVPINRRAPLAELADACAEYLAAKGRRLSLEWAMIDGVNDRDRDARQLAAYARPLRAHVNLIPLNPTPGWPSVGSPPERVLTFQRRLAELGVNATLRRNRGTDIDAACGQLRAGHVPTPTRRRDRPST